MQGGWVGEAGGGKGAIGESYRRVGMLRVPRHLPHDDDLCFQEHSGGVVV